VKKGFNDIFKPKSLVFKVWSLSNLHCKDAHD